MKATLVPDRITPMTAKEVALAFRSAFEKVVGRTPSNACLALIVAHSALETGRWKSIHCYNFGNIKASPTYEGLYCQFRCNEVINGKVQWFDPPHPQTNFRAFASVDDGAVDHLEFLAHRKRYAVAWANMCDGAPLAFVDSLKRAGYFTADEAPYSRAVVSLWKEYLPLMEALKEPEPEPAPPPDEPSLHEQALAAVRMSDPVEWSREERREHMGES